MSEAHDYHVKPRESLKRSFEVTKTLVVTVSRENWEPEEVLDYREQVMREGMAILGWEASP